MKRTERLNLKIDARTLLIIDEMAKRHKVSRSAIVRMFCHKAISEITDKEGYIK